MPFRRSDARNVFFYDARSLNLLGGTVQNGSVTEANFIEMLGILLITDSPFRVQQRDSGIVIAKTDNSLELGKYDIYCDSQINLTDEKWVYRLYSHTITGRDDGFRAKIRNRDKKCVLSGVDVPSRYIELGNWTSFEAAHIFPLAHENVWNNENYSRCITNIDDTCGISKINSCQNGILLRADIHQQFDQCLVSVDPNDNYKIVSFGLDVLGLDGRVLDPACRNPADPDHAADELLRWHFRQCVLANMKGAGEPFFEHDFTGGDMVKEIGEEPYGKERFEMEVAARLRGFA